MGPNGGSAAPDEPLIVLNDVNKWFGDLHVLKNVSLSVNRGEVVVIIGPSGSGKSTLCRTINRLETINSGEIRFNGQPLPAEGRPLARLRSEVGMVFQAFNLFAHKTVLENVTLGPIKVRKEKPAVARERAMALLERVGIANQAAKYPPSSPADSSNGPPSPAPWRCSPRRCCSMSRRARSTRRWSGRCST